MKKAIQQASILTFSNGFSKFLSMLFLVALTRLISVNEYGQFRYILNLASLLSLAILGVSTSLAKFLRETPGDNEIKKGYLTNSLSVMGIIFLVIFTVSWIFYDYYLLFGILLFGIMIESFFMGYSRGLLNIMKLSAFRPIKGTFQLMAMGVAVLLSLKIGVLEAALFFSLSGLLSLIILEIYRWEMELGLSISKEVIKKIINYMIPVTLGAVGWSVLLAVNPIVIERLRGTESVAYYTAGITLMQVFAFLPEAVSTMILPKVAGTREVSRIIRPFIFGVMGCVTISILILIGLYIFREWIIIMVFSREYLNAAPIVLFLAIGQISLVTHQLFASFWQGLGRPAVPSITITVGCIINLVASIILTNIYGIWGSALSYAISTTFSLILIAGYFMLKKKVIIES